MTLSSFTQILFDEKMREAFCSVKALIFSTKNVGIYQIFMFEILKKYYLMTWLVLNNVIVDLN